MPLRETVELDIRNAQNQLSQLENRFDQLRTPITIPVELTGEQAIADLRRQVAAVEQDDIDLDINTFGLESADATFRDLKGQIVQTRQELTEAQQRADRLGAELQETGRLGTSAFAGIRSAIGPLVATFAAGLGVREIVDQFKQAINAATSLTESMNAVNVVFGEGAAAIQKFGEDSAANVGLAASQVNELVTPIGALLQNFGLDGREAADAALELTTRAADLASVFNTDVNDALLAIGSALRGEQEPIRRFGVNLNAAALDAKALELGLVGVGEEVSQSIRGQAAYAEVLEQTAFAAGDFANTADSAANKQRVLSAQFEEARAELGQALLPAFESLLDAMPAIIEAVEELTPALAEMATGFADVAVRAIEALGPIARFVSDTARETGFLDEDVFVSFTEGLEGFQVAVANIDRGLGLELSGIADAFGVSGSSAVRAAEDFREFLTISQDVVDAIREGESPLDVFSSAFAELNAQVPITAEALGSLIQSSTIGADDLKTVLLGIIENAEGLGLTAAEIRVVRDAFNELFNTGERGEGLNFGRRGIGEATTALDEFRDSVGLTFSELEAQRSLEDAFGDLPTVVTNFADLQAELDRTGQSLNNFLTDAPEDTGIIGIFDDIETRALETLATLQRVSPELTGTLLDAFGDAPVNEETDKIEADIESFFTFLDEKAGERAELEFDLAIVASEAPNLAEFLASQGLAATDIAEAFATNLDEAAQAEALITGAEGMAAEVADQFAGFLETLTPEKLAQVKVFGEANFVSNPIRAQLQESALEMAQVLSDALSAETISPALTLDLSNVQITGAINTGQIAVGPGGGVDTAPIGAQSVNVTINNPTTLDLDTSATQSAQTIAAVSSSLPSIR